MRLLRLFTCAALLIAACSSDGFVVTDGGARDAVSDAPIKLDTTTDVSASDRFDAPGMCQTPNPANACPTAAAPCVPSDCHCFNGVWACTSDCGSGRNCGDGGADALRPADLCTGSGGTVTTAMCCQATSDFPNSCAVGACGCAPQFSRLVNVCTCPQGTCFHPQKGCARAVCTPGMDQSCNDNPALSSLHGHCDADRTCTCRPPFVVNPATGLCR